MAKPELPGESTSGRGLVGAIVLTVIHAVLGAGLFVFLILVVPRYAWVFEDFGVQLPVMARLVIGLSLRVAANWYLFVVPVVVAPVLDFVVLLAIGKLSGTMQTIVGVLLAIALAVLGAVIFLSVWMPWTNLIEGLG